ncbi:hypothetical protein GPL15_12370 [Clostridium sp. MCC353]|uniref:ester cyclase n=1 Tax=Clostridium sp. MCC353 TaxID=2592646 RepID=UPI001C00C0F0|nr:ester cyclase [Clostridium sp. MCC353]MBT9777298.1 hypothetical protein [Clostridium sp. MCC353]
MDYRERIRYFYEVIVSNHLIDKVSEYISDDCTVRIGERIVPTGVEGMRQHLIDVRKTYPNLKMTIIRQYCDGDYIISEFVTECIHEGEWLGIKPTGKKLTFTGVDIDKVVDGKIVEHGGAMNTFETLFEEKIISPT